MVVPEAIHNIMGGLESTGGVTLHNHRRKLKQRFETIAKLGQGTYGKVQLGVNKETGQEVAIKTIKKCKIETEADLIRIRREIQIMSSLRHPYIIHIYEVFENKDKMVLVMEYAAGGELYDYLSKQKVLDENEARRIFRQIAMAVYYCHKHQICHRDLKLENILLDDQGNAKIADFGLSNVFDNSRLLSTFCGSPLYASPEIVKGIPYRGPEVDCWSLGVLLYTLVYGAMPFDGSNFKRLVRQISAGDYFEPKNPSSASELIKGLLTVKGEDRLDITGVCQHEWMAEEGKVTCFRLAVELAEEVPNRLDLLLALAPQETQPAAVPEEVPIVPDKPARSQSLTSLSNVQPNFIPSPLELKKETEKENKEKERKRERSSSRSSKKDEKEEKPKKKTVKSKKKSDESVPREEIQQLLDAATNIMNKIEPEKVEEPKVEEENRKEEEKIETVLDQKVENQISEDQKVPENDKTVENAPQEQVNEVPKEVSKESPPKRRKSRVLETAEMFKKSPSVEKKEVLPQKKFSMSGVKVSDAKAAFERRSSLQQIPSPTPNFNLASTVNVNKLVMSELNKNKELEEKIKKENAVKVISHAISENELNTKKASTLPRRKLSKPSLSRTEPEHMVANTTVSQTIYPTPPIPPPRPSLVKQDSGPKEHIIPIFVEKRDETAEKAKTSAPISKQSSVSSRASTSSLGRQDSDTTVASAEPIRKSPREVIIPIAVEGGGYVTPSMSTLSKMSSLSENEEDPMRGFDLHSTRRKQHLETADSVSSDEDDDNFEMLTTENLYAKLLSRMRNLTQRLDEGRPMFPRLFQSSFDRRLDFDPTPPWRRNLTTTGSSSTLPRGFTAKSLRRLLSDEKGENLPPAVLRRKLSRTTSDSVQNGHENAKEETSRTSSLDRVKKYLEELNGEEISVGPSTSFASKYLKPRANYKPGTSQTSEFDKYINFKHSLEKERKTPRYDRVKELKEYRRSVSLLDEETPSKSILEKYLKNEKKNDSRVEKAIESLRRNSIEVENEFSESKLLKRAVSLEEVNPKAKNRNRRASSLKPEDTKTKKPPERKKLKKLELNKEFVSVSAESTPSADFDEARSFNSDTWSSSDLTERFYDVLSNMDDCVSERIRRKSFYHRFNLPKRNVYHRSSSNMERKRYF